MKTIGKILLFVGLCCLVVSCDKHRTLQTTGYVDSHYIYLSSPYGGYLQKLKVTEGQNVKAGELILQLNPEPQQQQVEEALALWRGAKDDLAELKANKNSVSQNKINAAEEKVSAAFANVKLIQWTVNSKKISTAVAGKIANIYYQEGEYVPPLHPIASLFVAKNMRIIFYVPEADLNKLALNKSVTILLGEKKYQSPIIAISQQAEFTPDVMFSERNKHKLVFKITAKMPAELQEVLKGGQPVEIDYE